MSDRLAEIKQKLANDDYDCVPDYGANSEAGPDIEWLVERLEAAEMAFAALDKTREVDWAFFDDGGPTSPEYMALAAILAAGEKRP